MSGNQTTVSWPLPGSADDVFRALTDPAALACWFAEHVDVEPRVGGGYRFWGRHTPGTPTAAEATQQITELTPSDCLAFTWTPLGVDSTVTLTIATEEAETKVTAVQAVANDLGVPRQKELLDDFWRLSLATSPPI